MIATRRSILAGLGVTIAWPGLAAARPADAKRLENRRELWANYARRTENMVARLVSTRETSLLDEPLVSTGQLAFIAPDTLALRDDGLTGSSTLIEGDRIAVVSNQDKAGAGRYIDTEQFVAAAWLADRLKRMFRADKPEALTDNARVNVPRGKGYRLELMPPKGSPVRAELRSVTVHLDPVAGAVTKIVIAEARGDRLTLGLSDHRQNVEPGDLDAIFSPIRATLP